MFVKIFCKAGLMKRQQNILEISCQVYFLILCLSCYAAIKDV